MRLMSSTSWEGIFTTIRNLFHTFMFYILKSEYLYRSRGFFLKLIFFYSVIFSKFSQSSNSDAAIHKYTFFVNFLPNFRFASVNWLLLGNNELLLSNEKLDFYESTGWLYHWNFRKGNRPSLNLQLTWCLFSKNYNWEDGKP